MPQLTIPDKLRNWNHDIWGLVSRDWHLEWPGHYSQFLRCFQSYRNSINWICLSKKRTYLVTAWVENMFVELTEESQNKGHEYPGAHNQVTSGIKSPQPWPSVPKTSVLDSVSFNYFTFFHRWFYPGILQVYKYALSGFNRHLQMNNGFPSHTPSEWSPPPTWRQEKDWTKDSDCQLCLRFGGFIWEWNFHCDSMRSCSEGWSSAYMYANIHLTWRSHSPP